MTTACMMGGPKNSCESKFVAFCSLESVVRTVLKRLQNGKMTQSAFETLRPVCVKLSKEPSISAVQQLRTLPEGMDEGSLQPLQQYVLFPLRLALREPKKM